jgi:hypothetical protein
VTLGCSPTPPAAPDSGGSIDAAPTDGGGEDAGLEDASAGPDTSTGDAAAADASTPIDGGTGLCLDYEAAIAGGLGSTIADAVQACARGACLSCALAGGTGTMCGEGGTMRSCVLDCIATNDFGECSGGTCDAGETCDGVCRNDAVTAVNEAITGGDLDQGCAGCFAGITDCIVANSCAPRCLAPGCSCDECQCDNECPAEFVGCSGLAPYLDCAMVAAMCS